MSKLTVAFAICLLLCGQLWAHADGVVAVEARRDGDAVIVEARARLDCDLQLAWDVLTAYDRYPDFIPDLKSSRVLSRSGNTAVIEQRGEAGFFLYHFPIEVIFDVTEVPGSSVSSRAVSGNFKEMTGHYSLSADEGGLLLTYSGRLVPAFGLPPLIGVPAVKAAVRKQFTALVQEIARRARPHDSTNHAR